MPTLIVDKTNEYIKYQGTPDDILLIIQADTDYHELDSWSSLTGLSVVAMIIQEYGVELDSQDVRKADTIEDLFNLVNERQA